MVVQHNLTAMNSNRMLGITTSSQAKSSEKLSSGYRINRAADDAAGLTISEKMRKQMRGLDRASTNAQDGVSAVQTAEGALTEVHSMLQRMNELANQAANGSNSESDRDAIIDALVTQLTTDLGADFTVAKDTNKLVITAKTAGAQIAAVAITSATVNGAAATATVTAGTDTTYKYTAFADKAELEAAIGAGTDIYHGDVDTKANFTPLAANTITAEDAYVLMAAELEKASNIGTDSNTKAAVVNKNDGTFEITEGKAETAEKLSFSLHVGADADMTNKINVDIDTMSASGLGIQGINVSDKTGMAATYAIDAIADAIAKVSSQRSALGAVQNRLEHTIANLDNVVENTTAAESRIRDTDMAEEMVTYSKNNILAQAGQSMLAQANQSNQGVLSHKTP